MSLSLLLSNAVTCCLATAGLLSLMLPAGAVTKLGSLQLTGTGDFMELPIGFMSDDGVTCLQFDLNFNPASLPLGAPVAGTAASGHRLDSTLVSPGLRRVVIYSTTLAPLDGGVILRFPARGASTSTVLPTVSGVRLVSTTGTPAVLSGTDLRPEPLVEAAQLSRVSGSSLTLTAPAGGLGPLTYQWYFEGEAIVGATGSSYAINKLASGNAGSYSVRISGPAGEVVSPVAKVTVIGNSPPVANPRVVTIKEDTSATLVLTGSDAEGDPLTYSVVTSPTKGKLTGTAPNLSYKPNANITGSDNFTFRVNDGKLNSATAAVTITISAVNDVPVAKSKSVTTIKNKSVAIKLEGSDNERSPLKFQIVKGPKKGTLTGKAPLLTYKPKNNVTGLDSFTFRVNDGKLNSALAKVNIRINAAKPLATLASKRAAADSSTAFKDPFAEFLVAAGVPDNQRGGTDDPDGDGLANLIEFVLGGNPVLPDTTIVPTLTTTTTNGLPVLEYRYKRKQAASGVIQVVEYTSEPSARWTEAVNGRNGVSITVSPADEGTEQVVATIPMASGSRFFRLRTTRP